MASSGSILSIGSAGSILSVGSAGSILSIGSAGSILSVGSSGAILAVGGKPLRGENRRLAQWLGLVAGLLGAVVLRAILGRSLRSLA